MNQIFIKIVFVLLAAAGAAGSFAHCEAEVVQGQAVIESGDTQKARADAMQDAMRTYVERKVGIHIQSTTEVDMGMVVSDKILAQSEGYVQINKVIREWQQGPLYCVTLDLTASDQKIQSAVKEVADKIRILQEGDLSRSGVVVVTTGRDADDRPMPIGALQNYVAAKMNQEGFRTETSDEAVSVLNRASDLNDPQLSARLRSIARETRADANAMLRGTIKVLSVQPAGDFYEASVHASFELVGFESDETNTSDDFFTAVGRTPEEAIRKAQDAATNQAVTEIAKKALLTTQSEMRGGQQHMKLTAVFRGITNRTAQEAQLRQTLQKAGCRIIRASFTSTGDLKIFFEATGYHTMDELDTRIRSLLPILKKGNNDEQSLGSQKLYYTF